MLCAALQFPRRPKGVEGCDTVVTHFSWEVRDVDPADFGGMWIHAMMLDDDSVSSDLVGQVSAMFPLASEGYHRHMKKAKLQPVKDNPKPVEVKGARLWWSVELIPFDEVRVYIDRVVACPPVNIPQADTSDPYVKIKIVEHDPLTCSGWQDALALPPVNGAEDKTEYQTAELNPEWKQLFRFEAGQSERQVLA